MKRKLIFGVVGLVVLAIAIVYFNQSFAFKKLIEKGGPRLTGTPVLVDDAAISVLSGTGSASNLRIGNPEGFSQNDAIVVEQLDLKMKPMSLFTKKIVIEELVIENPQVAYEVGLSGVNIRRLRKNMSGEEKGTLGSILDDLVKSKDEQKKPPIAPAEELPAREREVQIDTLIIRGGTIGLRSEMLNAGGAKITVPDIRIDNFTSGEGIRIRQVSKLVLATVIDTSLRAVANNPEALGKGAGGLLDALGDTIKGDANLETEGAVKEAVDILKGLFEKKE